MIPRATAFLPAAALIAGLAACDPTPEGPLGIPLDDDGVTRAGVATVDITPEITETFTDLNGNHDFDGCLDDPTASRPGCDEPFDDVDGDGEFDAVFIGGFGPMRPANEVHDPISTRALVLARDGSYVAFVVLDVVGLGSPRIHEARDRLVADGLGIDRLIVASTHNHQGPDTMGLWGDPTDLANPTTGLRESYQQRVTDAIEQSVREAAATMEPVDLTIGRVWMRDVDPYFNGPRFGGKNPDDILHGLVHDGRDPVLVSDQLLALQGAREDGSVLFTWTNWSGHPEVRGSSNNAISADWPGVTRRVLEGMYPGSTAIHMPECLGGMQSALGGDLPLVREDGTHVHETDAQGETVLDADGDPVPVYAERNSWEFVESHGWHIAEAAAAALDDGEPLDAAPIRVEAESFYVPIDNIAYKLLGPSGIFDLGLDDATEDPTLCPEAATSDTGCLENRTFRVQVGELGLITVPGELLPELFWGFPGDDAWTVEAVDPTARGPGSVYFPQHDPDCDGVISGYDECRDETAVGDCDCLSLHAWPYRLGDDDAAPMADALDTEYRAALSMTDNYLSYVIPEPDVNTEVSLLSDRDGDHYEDTVTISPVFATRLQQAQGRIDERW